jgi:predicted phage terminase large subunit-like protein
MEKSAIVVIMQRVHELDIAGAIIEDAQGMGYEHLCIPMRYEVDGPWAKSTSIGWEDPRKIDGELAWPERFPAQVVDNLERDLGPWAFSSQYQQNPAPRGGGIVKRTWFRLWENPQNKFPPFENVVAAVDPAYTEKDENDPSAMAIFATFRHPETNEFGIMLVHCWRKRLQIHGDSSPRFPGESAKAYERRCGDNWGLVEWIWHCCDAYGVQQLYVEGKASGISVFQEIERRQSLRPWSCDIDTGKGGGDKVSRLTAVQPLFSQGLIWAPDRDWADMFIAELCNFPKGKYDDLVDCASLALRKMREMGLIQHTDEREFELFEMERTPVATQALYPV